MFTLVSIRSPSRGLGTLFLLLIAALVLAGCAPRPEIGSATQTADADALIIDLPPLAIDVDEQGTMSIADVPLAPRLAALHAAMPCCAEMPAKHDEMTAQLAALAVPEGWVDFLQRSNIQYLQVNTTPKGVLFLVNGEPLPYLAWDAESLQATVQALTRFGVPVPAALEKLLPLAQNLGIGVIVRFRPRVGEAALPLYGKGDTHGVPEIRLAQAAFLQAVGAPPRIHLSVAYAPDGSFRVGTLSDVEWNTATGLASSSLRLDPAVLEQLSQGGVEQIRLSTNRAGIQVAVNGQTLPSLTWADGELAHLLGVTEQTELGEMWAPNVDWDGVFALVRGLLPGVQSAEFDLTVSFPPTPYAAVAASP